MNHASSQPGPQPRRSTPRRAAYRKEPQDNQLNLLEIFNAVRRGKWIILTVFWLCTMGAVVYAFTTEPEFEARSVLLVHNQQTSGLEDIAIDVEGLGVLTEIEILKQSLSLAERVAERLMEAAIVPKTGEPLPVLLDREGRALPVEDVARVVLDKRVQFIPVANRVSMIRIRAKSPVAKEASLIANFYAEEYQKRNQESSRASITASREFLREQEARYRSALDSTEARLEAFMKQEGVVSLDTEGSLLVRRVAEIDTQIGEASVELGLARASLDALVTELDRIEPGLASRIASGVENEIGSLQKRLADLEAQANEFYANDPSLRGNEASNPDLAEIISKIQQFQPVLDQLSREYVNEMLALGVADVTVGGQGLSYVANLKRQIVEKNITIRGLEAKLDALQQRVAKYETRQRDLPRKSMQYAQLEREKQAIEQIYLVLGEKAQEARVAEESELGYVEIVREALVPKRPVRPQKKLNILLGMLVGLAFGIGLAFLRQAVDHRIYRPDDLTKAGLDVVGLVPRFDRVIKTLFNKKEHVDVDGRTWSTSLLTLLNPLSPITECYRGIHTSLQFSRLDTVIETIVITSALPKEGKTVTSTNLAVTIAKSGRRTLYVDADLRRPRGHMILGMPRTPGLADILLGDAKIDLDSLGTGVDGLYALPAGRAVPNPAELLGSKRMRSLLEQLKQRFDVVIFDTAPVLLATDSILLSTQCDATVIVVAAGQTNQVAVNRTRELIENVGAPLIGAVLNRFDSRGSSGFGYDYGYGDGYRYRYGYDDAAPKKGLFKKRSASSL